MMNTVSTNYKITKAEERRQLHDESISVFPSGFEETGNLIVNETPQSASIKSVSNSSPTVVKNDELAAIRNIEGHGALRGWKALIIEAKIIDVMEPEGLVIMDCIVDETEDGAPVFQTFQFDKRRLEGVLPIEIGRPVVIKSMEKPGVVIQMFSDGDGYVDLNKFDDADIWNEAEENGLFDE